MAAREIEAVVEEAVIPLLATQDQATWLNQPTLSRRKLLEEIIDRIELRANEVRVTLKNPSDEPTAHNKPADIILPFVVNKRGVQTQLHVPGNGRAILKPDSTIVHALARTHLWRTWFERGKVNSLAAVADHEGCSEAYVRKLLPIAFLAPDITEAMLAGTQLRNLTLADLISKPLPLDWNTQRQRLGFPA